MNGPWKRDPGWGLKVPPEQELPDPWKQGAPLSQYSNMFTNQADSLSFGAQILLGFHDIGTIDEIIDHVIELNLQALSPPW